MGVFAGTFFPLSICQSPNCPGLDEMSSNLTALDLFLTVAREIMGVNIGARHKTKLGLEARDRADSG